MWDDLPRPAGAGEAGAARVSRGPAAAARRGLDRRPGNRERQSRQDARGAGGHDAARRRRVDARLAGAVQPRRNDHEEPEQFSKHHSGRRGVGKCSRNVGRVLAPATRLLPPPSRCYTEMTCVLAMSRRLRARYRKARGASRRNAGGHTCMARVFRFDCAADLRASSGLLSRGARQKELRPNPVRNGMWRAPLACEGRPLAPQADLPVGDRLCVVGTRRRLWRALPTQSHAGGVRRMTAKAVPNMISCVPFSRS
jgi:hypothetical protein